MNLLLIDTRINDVEKIVDSLIENVDYITFSYEEDTYESLREKIIELSKEKYDSIGIVQINYGAHVFDFLKSESFDLNTEFAATNILKNVMIQDASLSSWVAFTNFCKWCIEEKQCNTIDLLACNIWSDPDWVYVIETLRSRNIYIRASIDITGSGGNFILESDGVDMIGIYFTEDILAYKYSFDFQPYFQNWSSGNETFISGYNGVYNYTGYSSFTGTYSGNSYTGSDITTNIVGLKNHHVVGTSALQTVIYHKLDGTIITGGAYLYGGNASRDPELGSKLVDIKKIVPYGGGFFALKNDGTGILVWGANTATANASFKEVTTYNFTDAIGNSGAILGITNVGGAVFINTTVTTDLTTSTGTNIKSYVAGNTCFGVIESDNTAYLYDNAGTSTSITGVTINKIYANATASTSIILCSDNTIRNVSKTVLFTLNSNVFVRKFIPFYSNNWGICFTDNTGAFSITNGITNVNGMTDFVANKDSYAYIQNGSVILGGSTASVSGTHAVPTGYSVTDGNVVKIWSTNNTSYAALKTDRSIVSWGSDITGVNTPAAFAFVSIGGEITSCTNIQNMGTNSFNFINNNTIYSLGYLNHLNKTQQSIAKTENKNVDIQSMMIPSLVDYDVSFTMSPSTITYGVSTTVSYWSNNQDITAEAYRIYALCCGSSIVSTFIPTTNTNSFTFQNVVLSGEFSDRITIHDITNTNTLTLSFKLIDLNPIIIQPPSEPIITRIEYSVESAIVHFTSGFDGGSPIIKYQYRINDGEFVDATGTTSPITITGLTNGEITKIKLVALNAIGTSFVRSTVVNGNFEGYLSGIIPTNWNYAVNGTTTNSLQITNTQYNGVAVPVGYTNQCVLVNNQTGAGNGTLSLSQPLFNQTPGMKKLQFQMAHVPFVDETAGHLQVQYNGTVVGNVQLSNVQLGISNAPTIPYTTQTMHFDTKNLINVNSNLENTIKNIRGLQLWLDAQDTASLNLTGSSLNSWKDTSPNNITVSPFGGGNIIAPTYSNTALNGLPGIQFTFNQTSCLRAITPVGIFANAISIFVTFIRNNNYDSSQTLISRARTNNVERGMTIYGNTRGTQDYVGNWRYVTSRFNFNNKNTTGVFSYNRNLGITNEYFNGIKTLQVDYGSQWADNSVEYFFLGGNYNGSQGFDGTIGQIIIFNTGLTNDQRQLVEMYLATKWNMQHLMSNVSPYPLFYTLNTNISAAELNFTYYSARAGITPSSTSTLHLTGITLEDDGWDWIITRNSIQTPQVASIDASNSCAIVNLSQINAGIYPQKYQYSTDGVNYTDLIHTDTDFNGISMINGASISTDYPLKPNGNYSLKMVATTSTTTTQYAKLPSINKTTAGFSSSFWMRSNSTMAPVQSISTLYNANFDASLIELNTWRLYSAKMPQLPIIGWTFDASNALGTIMLVNGSTAYTDSIAPPTGSTQVVGLKTGGSCYGISMRQTVALTSGLYNFSFFMKARTGGYNASHGIRVSLVRTDGTVLVVSPIYTDVATAAYVQIQIPFLVPMDGNYILEFTSINPALVDSTIYISRCTFTYTPLSNVTPVFTMNAGTTYSRTNAELQLYLCNGLLYSSINNGTTITNKLLHYASLNDSNWYHVSFNISTDGTQTTYINGLLQSKYTGQPLLPSVNYISNYLGMSLTTSGIYDFNGYMDDIRIYGRALNGTEVMSIYNYINQTVFSLNEDASLLGRWKFNYSPYTNKVIVPLKNGYSYNVSIRRNDTPDVFIPNYNFGATPYAINTTNATNGIAPINWSIDSGSIFYEMGIVNRAGVWFVWDPFVQTDQAYYIYHKSASTFTLYQNVWLDVGTYTISYYYGGSNYSTATNTINVTLDGSGVTNTYVTNNANKWYNVKFNVSISSTGFKKLEIKTSSTDTTIFICQFTNFKIIPNIPSPATIPTLVSPIGESFPPTINASPIDGGAIVYFNQTATPGTTIVSYKYSLNEGQILNATGTTSPIIITGLTNGNIYNIRLYAVNSLGYISKSSNVSQTIPYKELLPVNCSSLDFSRNTLTVKYPALPYPDNTSNTRFIYSIDGSSTLNSINRESYTINGVVPSVLYDTFDKKVGNAAINLQGGYLFMPEFNSSKTGISISCWIKMTSLLQPTTHSKLFDFGNNKNGENTGYNNISLFTKFNRAYNPAVRLYTNVGGVYTVNWTNATFELDTWYHIAVIFNANQTVSLYINGISVGDQVLPYPESIFRNINYIGASTSINESYNFYGKIDDFRIYNGKMLTSSEVSTLIAYNGNSPTQFTLNNASELLFYYTFNQQPQDTSFMIEGLSKNISTNIIPYLVLDKFTSVPLLNANFDALYIEPYSVVMVGANDVFNWTIDTTYTQTPCYVGRGFYNTNVTNITTSPPISTEYYLAFPCIAANTTASKFYTNTYLPMGYITISFYAYTQGQLVYLDFDDFSYRHTSTTTYAWVLRTFSFYNYSSSIHKISIYCPNVPGSSPGSTTCFSGLQISCSAMQYRIPQKIMYYSFNTADLSGSFIKNQVTDAYDASLNSGAALTTTIKKYDTASVDLSGTNQFVRLPSFTLPTPGKGSGLTIAFWYYGVSNPSGNCNIIYLRSATSPTNDIMIQYAANGRLSLFVYNDAGATTFINPTIAFTPSVWVHMAFTIQYNSTMNDAIYSIYINGILITSSSPVNYYPKLIDRDNNVIINPGNIKFRVDDFKIFTDCLTTDEIRELWSVQTPAYENNAYKSYVSTRQITMIGTPHSPTIVTLVPSAPNQLTAYFNAPTNNGGSSITGYKYSIGINSTQLYDALGITSPIVLTNIPSNQSVEIFLYAVNTYGISTKSNMLSTMAFGFDNTPLNYISPTPTSIDVSFQETVATGYQPIQYKYTFNGTTTDFSNQIIEDISYKGKCLLMNGAWTYDGFIFGTNANSTMVTSGAGTNATTIILTKTGFLKVGWVLFVDGASATSVINAVSMNGTTATVTLATPITWITAKSAVAYPNGDNQMYITIGNGSIATGWKYRTTSGIYTVSSTSAATGVATITFAETITGMMPTLDVLSGIFTPPPILFNSYLSLYPYNLFNLNSHVMFENFKYEQTGLTIAVWMWSNVASTVTSARLFNMNNLFGLRLNGSTGIMTADFAGISSATTINTTGNVNTRTWVHVAFTMSFSKTVTIYINGIQNATGTITNYPAYNVDSAPICVIGSGLVSASTDSFQGYISDFRFYNGKALSASEITTLYAYRGEANFALDTDATLSTRFKFDLNSNEFIQPRRDYTLLNGVKYDSANAIYGVSSFRFDSSGSTFVSPQIHSATLTSSRIVNRMGYSICLWVKPNISSNSGYTNSTLISSNVRANSVFNMRLTTYNSIQIQIGQGGSAGTTVTFNNNVNNNTWSHIVFTMSSNGYGYLYINGSLVGNRFFDQANDMSWPIVIGSSVINGNFDTGGNNNTNAYNGHMDDIRMYSGYILTQQEIQTLYTYRGEDPAHYLNTHPYLQIWCKADQTMSQQQTQLIDNAYIPAVGAFISTIDKAVGTASMRIPAGGIVKMPPLTISTSGFSISFWLRCQSYASNNYILDCRSLPSTANEFAIVANAAGNGSIGMYMNGTLYSNFNSGVIITNQWVHVTFTITSAGSTILYINGTSVATISTGYPTIKGKTVNYLSSAFSATFDGCIDDLRIYNGKVLTSSEVSSIYQYKGESGFALNSDVTLSYYPFEPYEDKHIQCLHTVVKPSLSTPLKINNVQYSTDSIVNKYSIYIPYGTYGRAGYVTLPGITPHPHGFTISTWIKPTTQPGTNTILFQMFNPITANASNFTPCSYYVYLSTGGDNKIRTTNTALINSIAGVNTFASNFTINTNAWQFLTIVVNAMQQTISLYINGALVQMQTNKTYMNHVPFYTNTVSIGSNTATDGYVGYIDDFRFYNGKILSDQEIAALYAYRGELGFSLDSDPTLIVQYPKESYSSAKSARNQLSGLTTGTNYPYTLSATFTIKNLIQNGNFDMDGIQTALWALSSTYSPPTMWLMSSNLISSTVQTPRLSGTTGLTGIGFTAIPYPYVQAIFMDFPVTILTTINSSSSLYQNVYLTPDTYTFTYFATSRGGVFSINISLYCAIGDLSSNPHILLTSSWNKYSYDFTISEAGSYPVKIGFIALSTASQTSIAITGISLSKTTVATRTLDVIPYTNPDPPQITNITGSDKAISIYLDPPTNTGGLPISKYKYSIDNGNTFQDTNQISSPITISGLTNGTSYQVILQANNSRLDSINSNMIVGIPYTNPTPPTITTLVPGNKYISVYFSLPLDNGGLPILKYTYSINNGDTFQDAESISSPFDISGLTNGTSYQVIIRANNSIDSLNSNMVASIPYTNPDPPIITNIVEGNSYISIDFSPPLNNGGLPILKYTYSMDDGITFNDVNSSPILISGLTNGVIYNIRFRSNNSLDSIIYSLATGTPYTNPSPPTIESIEGNNQQLEVYFTPPNNNGGHPIKTYKYSINGGTTFIDANSNISPIIIPNLTNGTPYTVILKANNDYDSLISNAKTGIPYNRPDPPIITSIYTAYKEITITFTPSLYNGGLPITSYFYSLDRGVTYTRIPDVNTTTFTVGGLINGYVYEVIIIANNSVEVVSSINQTSNHNSFESNVYLATPASTPDAPTINNIESRENGILYVHFSFNDTGGSPIYKIQYTTNNWVSYQTINTSQSPFRVSNLQIGISYPFQMKSYNNMGLSPTSNILYGMPVSSITKNTTLHSKHAMPPKGQTSDGSAEFSQYRRLYEKTLDNLLNEEPTKKWTSDQPIASTLTFNRKIIAIGEGSLNKEGEPISFVDESTVTPEEALRRLRRKK